MSEIQEIKKRYERRENIFPVQSSSYSSFISRERERLYKKIIENKFPSPVNVTLIEIGAGGGSNLHFFHQLGIKWQNIYANELLGKRLEQLKANYPEINCLEGDAAALGFTEEFDIVFQSTVFTSILDNSFKKNLAAVMWRMLKPGGIILWYDFTFNNPNNRDVRGVKKNEISRLFPQSVSTEFYKVTLAPPIGRRIGLLYPFFNLFPFLRTHLIAVIKKLK